MPEAMFGQPTAGAGSAGTVPLAVALDPTKDTCGTFLQEKKLYKGFKMGVMIFSHPLQVTVGFQQCGCLHTVYGSL